MYIFNGKLLQLLNNYNLSVYNRAGEGQIYILLVKVHLALEEPRTLQAEEKSSPSCPFTLPSSLPSFCLKLKLASLGLVWKFVFAEERRAIQVWEKLFSNKVSDSFEPKLKT